MKHRRPFQTWKDVETDEPVPGPKKSLRLFAFRNPRMNFIEVYLWSHAYQMRAARHSATQRERAKTAGFFHEFQEQKTTPNRRGNAIGSKKLGEIHHCCKFLTVDTISHEVHHAVLAWGRRLKRPLPQTTKESWTEPKHNARWSPEELSATLQGQWTDDLVQAFCEHVAARK